MSFLNFYLFFLCFFFATNVMILSQKMQIKINKKLKSRHIAQQCGFLFYFTENKGTSMFHKQLSLLQYYIIKYSFVKKMAFGKN